MGIALGVLALAAAERTAQEPALERVLGAQAPDTGWTSEVHRLRSELLGEELRLFVAKPPSFERSQRRYPVLFLLDGQYYFAEVASVVASLASYGQIPELVLVGIESHDRRIDFTPVEIQLPDVMQDARAGLYLDFLEQELVPAVESKLRAGKPRVLVGHSHAGMLVLHAVARRPAAFPWVVAVDAPVHHDHGFLAKDLLRALQEPERPSVRVVALNVVYGWSDEQAAELESALRPDDRFVSEPMPRETHESMLFAASYRGLQALFADSSALAMRELAPLEIDSSFAELERLYGAPVDPPEPLMRRVVEDFLLEGRGARAGVWLERYVAAYGAPQDLDELTQRIAEVTAQGEPDETVAGLLALPRATPEEMREHLGEWRGTTWMDAGPREPATLRFWVEEGEVRGTLDLEYGPTIALEYVRFREGGALEFGFKNGMRPRGLIMYMDATPGGPLEGEVAFRGMRFTPPPGIDPPEHRFSFERVDAER